MGILKKKTNYTLKNKSLMKVFLISSLSIFSLFLVILILSYNRFNDYKTLIYGITDRSMPEIIKIGNVYAKIQEFAYLNEQISSAKDDIQRKIAYEQIKYKIFLINKFDIDVFNKKELREKFLNIEKEFSTLNDITNYKLNARDNIKVKLSQIKKLGNTFIQNIQNNYNYPKWKIKFLLSITIAFQSFDAQTLKELLTLEAQIKDEYGYLERNAKTKNQKKHIRKFKLLVLGENGLLSLKKKVFYLVDKSSKLELHVKKLIQSFIENIEEISMFENDKLVKKTRQNSQELEKQIGYMVVVAFSGLIFLILIIFYFRAKIVNRLVKLNKSVKKRLDGGKEDIIDKGNDEISSIANTFNFFAATVQKQNEKLKELSLTDSLTSISNRRFFDIRFQNELNFIKRYGYETSILMMDVDNFKPYNDNYGHIQGDKCLQTLATGLKSIIRRDMDLLARYGGEEFVCILSNSTKEDAKSMAKLIIKTINELNILHEYNAEYPHVTLSIGITTISKYDVELNLKNIENADKALYEAKKRGKNTFVHFDELEQNLYM